MFINCTNHPIANWSQEQLSASSVYGELFDVAFPNVSPLADAATVQRLAIDLATDIVARRPNAVLCAGEPTLLYHLVRLLKKNNLRVLAATTERCSVEEYRDGTTVKTNVFKFVMYREY